MQDRGRRCTAYVPGTNSRDTSSKTRSRKNVEMPQTTRLASTAPNDGDGQGYLINPGSLSRLKKKKNISCHPVFKTVSYFIAVVSETDE